MQYVIGVEVKRGVMSKNLKRTLEFIVEIARHVAAAAAERATRSCPSRSRTSRSRAITMSPTFKIVSGLDSVACNIGQELTGEVVVEECSATIKSIELQLVRVETCGYRRGWRARRPRSRTSRSPGRRGQRLEDPGAHGLPAPLHVPHPVGKTFKVEFEVNLVILFSDGHLLTENFPLKLSRASRTAQRARYSRCAN